MENSNNQMIFIPPARRGKPSVYKPEFCDWVIEAGARGCSKKGMWAYLVQEKQAAIAFSTFETWLQKNHQCYIKEFADAVREGQILAQRAFEEIGMAAAAGQIPKHASATYQFLVKNRFRSDYKDETHQTVNKQTSIRIDPTASPQLAAQQYKDLILESGSAETFEDFFGDET